MAVKEVGARSFSYGVQGTAMIQFSTGGVLIYFWYLKGGCLFETGCLFPF